MFLVSSALRLVADHHRIKCKAAAAIHIAGIDSSISRDVRENARGTPWFGHDNVGSNPGLGFDSRQRAPQTNGARRGRSIRCVHICTLHLAPTTRADVSHPDWIDDEDPVLPLGVPQ